MPPSPRTNQPTTATHARAQVIKRLTCVGCRYERDIRETFLNFSLAPGTVASAPAAAAAAAAAAVASSAPAFASHAGSVVRRDGEGILGGSVRPAACVAWASKESRVCRSMLSMHLHHRSVVFHYISSYVQG